MPAGLPGHVPGGLLVEASGRASKGANCPRGARALVDRCEGPLRELQGCCDRGDVPGAQRCLTLLLRAAVPALEGAQYRGDPVAEGLRDLVAEYVAAVARMPLERRRAEAKARDYDAALRQAVASAEARDVRRTVVLMMELEAIADTVTDPQGPDHDLRAHPLVAEWLTAFPDVCECLAAGIKRLVAGASLAVLEEFRATWLRHLRRRMAADPGLPFRAVDRRPLGADGGFAPDLELTRCVALGVLASNATYKGEPSRFLEEEGPGLAEWLVLHTTLRDGAVLLEGPGDLWVLAFRGTQTLKDKLDDARIIQTTRFGCQVHAGFAERADEIPLTDLQALLRKGHRLLVCGHSLGGAIASLVALRLLESAASVPLGPDYVNRIQCVTFGMPFVGCEKLGDLVQRHRYQFHHCVHNGDVVPRLAQAVPVAIPYAVEVAACAAAVLVPEAAVFLMAARPAAWCAVALLSRPYRPFGTYLFFTSEGDGPAGEERREVLRVTSHASILALLGDGQLCFADHSMAFYVSAFDRLRCPSAAAVL